MKIIKSNFFTDEESKEICKYAENKKIELSKTYSHENHAVFSKIDNVNNQITTFLYNDYDFFLDNPSYIRKLKSVLQNNVEDIQWPIIIQSWVNIYSSGEGIGVHHHDPIVIAGHKRAKKVYAANIFIGGPTDIGVNYIINGRSKKELNTIGEIQIFDGSIDHYVEKNSYNEKRYTVGITMSVFDDGLDYSKLFFPHEKIEKIDNLYIKIPDVKGTFILI